MGWFSKNHLEVDDLFMKVWNFRSRGSDRYTAKETNGHVEKWWSNDDILKPTWHSEKYGVAYGHRHSQLTDDDPTTIICMNS